MPQNIDPGYFVYASSLSTLREEYRQLLLSERYQDKRQLNRYGYSLYSQCDEDGIIEEIFNRIGETSRVFVEFGCGDGLENNSHALFLKRWGGLWIEGNQELVASIRSKFNDAAASESLMVLCSHITAENINDLIRQRVEGEIDLLSVDVDGNDFHILNAITCVSPRVIVVEYNARKGPSIDWVMDYNAGHRWDGTDYYGASLKAYEKLLDKKGYFLVGCSISGVNAFFVRKDLVTEELFLTPYTSEQHFEPQRMLLKLGVHTSLTRNYGPWKSAEEILKVR